VTPADRHRSVAEDFSARVAGTSDWDAPAPVAGWVARDVVDHLVTWLPGLLESRGLPRLPATAPAPSVDADPAQAWSAHAAAVQALLEGPDARVPVDDPMLGGGTLAEVVDRLYTTDVFMHTWDLARATGQDDTLDADACADLLAGMERMDAVLRASGQFGPRVEVPPDASAQDRLIGFIGRDPGWRPA
jgi:uncharacterized protein (TIGR03086 family)